MRAADWKGTSNLVAPHELSSKFLLRVRGGDRPAALAYLDQQEILRQVFPALRQNTLVTTDLFFDRSGVLRHVDRSRLPARTATTRDSANGNCTHAKFFAASHD